MHRLKVGVLRGGPSSEYDVSLKTGASVLQHLDQERYVPVDVFIDRAGVWHMRGIPAEPIRILQGCDVAFNAMHGEYGEDGTLQRLLETSGTPYTGSRALGAALAMNKTATKNVLAKFGIKMPRHQPVQRGADLATEGERLFNTMTQPVVVKPASCGSSVCVSIVRDPHAISDALESALSVSPQALVEEHISGSEATCGVLEDFRDEGIYALPPTEIIPPKGHRFFNYEAKYGGESEELCPGRFSHEIKQEIETLARLVHEALGLRHYSRSDFIVHPRRGIYFLEVNTLPGLTEHSLFPKAAEAVGCTFPELIEHLVTLAHGRR